MEDFLPKIEEILEAENVSPESKFRDVCDWDSLKGFSIIVLLEQDYGREISVEEFLKCETIGDLAALAGVA